MKKSIISMMLVGEPSVKKIMIITALAVMLGTVNSFGSVKNTHFQSPKTEKVVKSNKKQNNDCDCKTCKDIVKKQQKSKVIREAHQASSQKSKVKKNQCTCKECKKVNQKNQKSKYTCKMQPNINQKNTHKK